MQLITISGLDGSGKTTQLDKLEKHLKDKGSRVYRFHIIEFSIASKILGFKNKNKKSKSQISKSVTKAGAIAILLRKIALILDTVRFAQLMFVFKTNNRYDYVLADRYFYDQIVNIHYLEKSITREAPFWQKIAEKLITKPNFAFFVKVSPKIALSRDREIEQGKQFLIDKQNIFDRFINDWKIKTIDGEGIAEDVFVEIEEQIKKTKV